MVANAGTATGYLDLNITGFLTGLETALAQTGATMNKIDDNISRGFIGVGNKLKSVGTTLTVGLTAPILGIATAAVKVSTDFEQSMAQVQAVSGATGDDFTALRDKALEMGAKTKFSASESADALYYMALAGWDTSDMLNGISGVMDLAAASGEDLAHVSDIVTDGLTAFGMSAQESNHFADVLAQTMARSNTDVNMLGEAFKYVGPVAGAFGYSIEDVSIALGLMANAGIKSSSAGTSLRQALVQLTSPSETAAMYMEKFGISLFNSDGSAKNLMSIMTDLRNTFRLTNVDIAEATKAAEQGDEAWAQYAAGLNLPANEQEKLTALTEIFGARAMPAMLAMIQASDEDFNSLADSIYNCDGAASQMSETMLNTFSGQLTLLKSALEGLGIQIGDILLPHLKNFVTHIQNLVDWLSKLTPEQKESVLHFAAFAAAIGPVLLVLGKMVTGVGNMIGAFAKIGPAVATAKNTLNVFRESVAFASGSMVGPIQQTSNLGLAVGKLKGALAGLAGPIAAVVAVIGVLVAAFLTLWNTNEDFRNSITEIWNGIVNSFNIFCQGIVDRLNDLGFNFQSITDVIGAIWQGFCDTLAPIFEGAFSVIATVFQTALDIITGILDIFIGLFTGNWEQMGYGLQEIFGGVWDGITGIFNTFVETFTGIVDVFLGWFGTSWNELFGGEGGGLTETFSNFWNGLIGLAQPFFDWCSQTFGPVLDSIRELWDTCWSGLQDVFTQFWNAFQPVLESGLTLVQELWDKVWPAIQQTFQTVWDAIKGIIDQVWPIIENVLKTGLNVLKDTFETVWNAIKTVVETAMKVVQKVIDTVTAAIKGDWKKVWDNVKDIAKTIWDGIKNLIKTVIDGISNIIKSVLDGIKNTWDSIWNAIKTLAQNVWNGIKDVITNAINGARDTISNVLNSISSTWSSIWNNVKSFISDSWNNIKSTVSDGVNGVSNFIGELPGRITGFFSNAGSLLINAGRSIIDGLLNGLKSAVGAVWDFVGGIASKIASIKGPLDYDKKLLIPAGKAIMGGLQNGIAGGLTKVLDDVSDIAGEMVDELGDAEKDKWFNIGYRLGVIVCDGFIAAIAERLQDAFSQAFSGILDTLPGFGENALLWASDGLAVVTRLNELFTITNERMLLILETANNLNVALFEMVSYIQQLDSLSGMMQDTTNQTLLTTGNNLNALPAVTIDYEMLAQTLYAMLQKAPIQNNIDVTMEDGAVYLDNERVGRSVAPVVSRVMAREQNLR